MQTFLLNRLPGFDGQRAALACTAAGLGQRWRVQAAPLAKLSLAGVLALGCGAAAAYDSGSTGADGAFSPAVNTVLQLPPSGVFNFTSVNIPAGVTVRFTRNARNTPVVMLVQGSATIAGTIDMSGGDSADTGSSGNGLRSDDGLPGIGGPGGFDGGRGGSPDSAQRAAIVEGGTGQGPGGGQGGRVVNRSYGNCNDNRYSDWFWYGLGAAHASNGPEAYYSVSWVNCNGGSPAALAYGTASLQPLIGGSGGGGSRATTTTAGTGGGGGGGAILIAASDSITLTGAIRANGGNAGQYSDRHAGGGSGGAIRLVASTVAGAGALNADAGCSYRSSDKNRHCYDYLDRGSVGRIRIEADTITYTGASSPQFSFATPSADSASTAPSLGFASVAGVAVSDNPSGVDDVVLPADLTNPVTVGIRASNVPLGSTVQVRLVPAQGLPVLATSTALQGSMGASTATATLALPQGPSRLEAYATFTVSVALGQSLAVFAQNESVQQVELTGGVGVDTTVVLVTTSGRRHAVPASWLHGLALGG